MKEREREENYLETDYTFQIPNSLDHLGPHVQVARLKKCLDGDQIPVLILDFEVRSKCIACPKASPWKHDQLRSTGYCEMNVRHSRSTQFLVAARPETPLGLHMASTTLSQKPSASNFLDSVQVEADSF